MKKNVVIFLVILGFLVIAVEINGTVWAESATKKTVFHIPQIDGIKIDGTAEDWKDSGFCVDFITAPDGRILHVDDFDAKFRLGWNQHGLLVLAEVRDDVPVEHENRSRLWRRDCVELFFSKSVGSTQRHQIVIASGADPNYEAVRQRIYDWRPPDQRTGELTAQVVSQISTNGYVVEAMLPWNNIGVKPSMGVELGFQFVANDDDGPGDSSGPLRVAWYPAEGPGSPLHMYSLRLSDKPSERIVFQIHREVTKEQYSVSIQGTGNLIDRPVALKSADKTIVQSKMDEKDGRASRIFKLDPETYPDFWPQIEVVLGEKMVHKYAKLPTLNKILSRYIEVLGGRDAIVQLTSRVGEGQFVDDLGWAIS